MKIQNGRIKCALFSEMHGKTEDTPALPILKKRDAIKALEYHGKGYVEASRQVKYTYPYDGTRYGCESKKIYELN